MKVIKYEVINGMPQLTTSTKRLFRKSKIRVFKATDRYVSNFFKWVELPNNELVGDSLSFQLNTWKEIEESK